MENTLRSQLSDELSCQICFEQFMEPKSLKCLHTFCKDCLATYVRKQFGDRKRVDVPCPICRECTALGSNGIDGLPTNFIYNNLAEMVSKKSQKVEVKICGNCEKSEAMAKCVDCDELLCSECKHAHGLVKITRDHTIIYLTEDVKMKKKVLKEAPSMKWVCDDHQEKITCFCFHCTRPVCPFCMSEMVSSDQARKHNFMGLNEAMAKLQLEVDEKLETVQEKRGELEEKIQVLVDVDEALTDSMTKTQFALKKRSDEVHRIIDKWLTKQEKDLEVNFKKSKEEMWGRKTLLEGYLEKLVKGSAEITEQLRNGDQRILLRRKDLERQANVFRDTATFNTQDMPDSVSFSLPDVKDIQRIMKPLLTDVTMEKQASLQRSDSMSSLGSVGGSLSSAGDKSMSRGRRIHCNPVTTARIEDVQVFGMTIGRCSGDLFVVNSNKREVIRYKIQKDDQFSLLQNYGGKKLKEPLDVDQLPDGRIVVSDGKEGHSVKVFNLISGKMEANLGHLFLKKACGISTTSDGHIVVTDADERAVYILKMEGQDKVTVIAKISDNKGAPQFDSPQYLACFQDTFVVSDKNKNFVKAFNLTGRFKYQFGRFGVGKLQMKRPEGVCCDKEGRVYISDVQNGRIQILSRQGRQITYVKVNQIGGKIHPFPTMLGITADENLLMMNEAGWIKVISVQYLDVSDQV